MRSSDEMRGVRVLNGKRKIGKVSTLVFFPTGKRVCGFIIRRPDFLWMFKRKDKFLALDSFVVRDGRIVVDPKNKEAWDEKACFRLDIDFDKCIIWENTPVRTVAGENRGRILNVSYDERNGNVLSISINDGLISKSIIGNFEIPGRLVRGYNDGYIWIENEATKIEASGGAAAKAGEGVAKAGQAASNAAAATGAAINKGAYKMGELIGKAKKSLEPEDEVPVTTTAATTKPATQPVSQVAPAATATQTAPATAARPATQQAARPAQAAPQKKSSGNVGRAIGKSLSGTKGMFAAFKEEYNKAKNE